jgi:three-Cys-motif partner protein
MICYSRRLAFFENHFGPIMPDHTFGGKHTELKLSVIEAYLKAYTTALRKAFSELWYIDAFAGTGSRAIVHPARPRTLFDEPPVPEKIERARGSAQIAIDVKPPFDFLVFVEKKLSFKRALDDLAAKYPNRRVQVIHEDANTAIRRLVKGNTWESERAVLLLDPYGMDVEWSTLKAIARTKAIDVWYFFSLSGFFRQATVRYSKLDDSKRNALNRILGTAAWEEELYPRRKMRTLDGTMEEVARRRTKTPKELEAYMKTRLETIFGKVLEPLKLPIGKGAQRYSLFLCISSDAPAAIKLATKIGDHILKLGRAS